MTFSVQIDPSNLNPDVNTTLLIHAAEEAARQTSPNGNVQVSVRHTSQMSLTLLSSDTVDPAELLRLITIAICGEFPSPPPPPALECPSWCDRHTLPWAEKCRWTDPVHNCLGCHKCDLSTPVSCEVSLDALSAAPPSGSSGRRHLQAATVGAASSFTAVRMLGGDTSLTAPTVATSFLANELGVDENAFAVVQPATTALTVTTIVNEDSYIGSLQGTSTINTFETPPAFCFPRYGRGDCSEFDYCGAPSGNGECVGGLCECAPSFCGLNCTGVLRCMWWDDVASDWSSRGLRTIGPLAYMASEDGFLHCRTDTLIATSFAGVCVHGFVDDGATDGSVGGLEGFGLGLNNGLYAGLDASVVFCALTLSLAIVGNVLTVRWARQHRQKKTVPASQRDPAWWPIIVHSTKWTIIGTKNAFLGVVMFVGTVVQQSFTTVWFIVLAPIVILLWLTIGLKNALVRSWINLLRSMCGALIGVGVSVLRTIETIFDALVFGTLTAWMFSVKTAKVSRWLIEWSFMLTRDWLIAQYFALKAWIARKKAEFKAWVARMKALHKARQERLKRERLRRKIERGMKRAALAADRELIRQEKERKRIEVILVKDAVAADREIILRLERERKRIEGMMVKEATAADAVLEKARLEKIRLEKLRLANEKAAVEKQKAEAATAAANARRWAKCSSAQASKASELEGRVGELKGQLAASSSQELADRKAQAAEEAKAASAKRADEEAERKRKELMSMFVKQDENADDAEGEGDDQKAISEPLAALIKASAPEPHKLSHAIPSLTETQVGSMKTLLPPAIKPLAAGSLSIGRLPILTIDLANAGDILSRDNSRSTMSQIPPPSAADQAKGEGATKLTRDVSATKLQLKPMVSGRIPMDDALRQLSASMRTESAAFGTGFSVDKLGGGGIGGKGMHSGGIGKGMHSSASMPTLGASLSCRKLPTRSGLVCANPAASDTDRGSSAQSSLYTESEARGPSSSRDGRFSKESARDDATRAELEMTPMSAFLGTHLMNSPSKPDLGTGGGDRTGGGGASSRPGSGAKRRHSPAATRPPPRNATAPPLTGAVVGGVRMPKPSAPMGAPLAPGQASRARMSMAALFNPPTAPRPSLTSSQTAAAQLPIRGRSAAPTQARPLSASAFNMLDVDLDADGGDEWGAEMGAEASRIARERSVDKPVAAERMRAKVAARAEKVQQAKAKYVATAESGEASIDGIQERLPPASPTRNSAALFRAKEQQQRLSRARDAATRHPSPGKEYIAAMNKRASERTLAVRDDVRHVDKVEAAAHMKAKALARAEAIEKAKAAYIANAESFLRDVKTAEAKKADAAKTSWKAVGLAASIGELDMARLRHEAEEVRRLEVEEAWRRGGLNTACRAGALVAVKDAEAELDNEEWRLQHEIEQIRFFNEVEVYTTRCDRGYLDALARWHTIFSIVCQPYPSLGASHPIDLEQQVQCFWTCLVVELWLAAALAHRRPEFEHELIRSAWADGLLASLGASLIALLGCRAVFVLGGPAGRVRIRDGAVPKARGWDIAVEACIGRVFCHSRGGNIAFLTRWLRSAIGWGLAWSVFVGATVLSAQHVVGLPKRTLARAFSGWAFAQITTWLLMEPAGIFILMMVGRLVHWLRRARTVPIVTPTKAKRSGADDEQPLALASSGALALEAPSAVRALDFEETPTKKGPLFKRPKWMLKPRAPRLPSRAAVQKYQVEPPVTKTSDGVA